MDLAKPKTGARIFSFPQVFAFSLKDTTPCPGQN